MLVRLMPGADRRDARTALTGLHGEVAGLADGAPGNSIADRVSDYLGWANKAVQQLGGIVHPDDIAQLVLTKRHEAMLTAAAAMKPGVLQGLLELELRDREQAFAVASATLQDRISRWSALAEFVSFDTSVYIHHPDKLEDIDIPALAGQHGLIRAGVSEVLGLVPMAVIDELDRLKESKDRQTRWRAGYTLAVFDRIFQKPAEPATLQTNEAGVTARLEIMFDEPHHQRLPNTDDEIISRLAAAQPLAARAVTLFTYDTGQHMRARRAGLGTVKLAQPLGDEPAPS